MAGIYLHIPFCKQACHYCDFHFSTQTAVRQTLIASMNAELHLQQSYLGNATIETIYFGGGTPSMLTPDELQSLRQTIDQLFKVSPAAEVTLEANPDDLTPAKLEALHSIGINRLSIGIQSFHDDVLQFLNRAHTASAAMDCVRDARAAGFTNISIDLIYAIPGQTDDAWLGNIQTALSLSPEHISSYSLTIEDKTVFGKWAAAGKLNTVNDDRAAGQLELLIGLLNKNGYIQYEVSNFSKPGFESQHNSSYWKEQPYLGIGPSAHSYNGVSRQFNIANNHLYIQALGKNSVPFEIELLSREDHINEYLLTRLRTIWGCDLRHLKGRYAYDLLDHRRAEIDSLTRNGLAMIANQVLTLTPHGRLLADKIASDLFL
jgi:oxygen-independent coproporphyrinogen-3 oxidase